jgi:hypothetical protein
MWKAVKMALGNGLMWLESMQPSRLNFKILLNITFKQPILLNKEFDVVFSQMPPIGDKQNIIEPLAC